MLLVSLLYVFIFIHHRVCQIVKFQIFQDPEPNYLISSDDHGISFQ